MTIEKMLPLLVAAMYAVTGCIHAGRGSWAACGLWICYGLANVFLVFMESGE